MSEELIRLDGETDLQYHERLIYGKLENKTLSDIDYYELSSYLYGKNISSDNARRMVYGSKYTLDLIKNQQIINSDIIDNIPINSKQTTTINSDSSQTSENQFYIEDETKLRDFDYLLRLHNYNPELFELINAKNSKWNVSQKNDVNKVLYSSKITVKPKNGINLDYVKNILIENCKNYKKIEIPILNIKESGKILEVNIADLHLGKLAWQGEVDENYDYKIASERFKYIILDILQQVKHLEFEKIIFVWSNDFYHFDTISSTTTAGTVVDSDLRWQKLFRVGVELLVWAIDILSQKAMTETFYIGSNHDKMTSFYATNYLYAWYKDNPNVNVSYDCIARKYIEYGNVMIGYCHGGDEGKNINNIMAKEKPEIFGRTKFRYMHAAHFHSNQGKNIIEDGGCIVHYLGSPTSTDSWHYSKGYLGAIKCGYGFVYDKELGQRMEIRSNII